MIQEGKEDGIKKIKNKRKRKEKGSEKDIMHLYVQKCRGNECIKNITKRKKMRFIESKECKRKKGDERIYENDGKKGKRK